MEYVVIDPETFEVSVADRLPTAPALVAPVYDIYTLNAEPPPLADVGGQEIADAYERELERKGTGALPVLPSPPDLFLYVLIQIMWEGIVQGLTFRKLLSGEVHAQGPLARSDSTRSCRVGAHIRKVLWGSCANT